MFDEHPKLKCFTTSTITKFGGFMFFEHFYKVHDHKWPWYKISTPQNWLHDSTDKKDVINWRKLPRKLVAYLR